MVDRIISCSLTADVVEFAAMDWYTAEDLKNLPRLNEVAEVHSLPALGRWEALPLIYRLILRSLSPSALGWCWFLSVILLFIVAPVVAWLVDNNNILMWLCGSIWLLILAWPLFRRQIVYTISTEGIQGGSFEYEWSWVLSVERLGNILIVRLMTGTIYLRGGEKLPQILVLWRMGLQRVDTERVGSSAIIVE